MTNWHQGPLLGFDLETTGIDVENDRIVTASTVHIKPGGKPWTDTTLTNPGIEIPETATAIHGITTERARRDGWPAVETLQYLIFMLQDGIRRGFPLVTMNGCFDFTLFDRELQRYGKPSLEQALGRPLYPVIDVAVLDKQVSHRRGRRRLVDLCEHYGVPLDNAHDSGHDALAACRIAYRIAELHPEIGDMSLNELHRQQIGWRKQQCSSLRSYFDRIGTAHDGIPGDWPMVPRKQHSMMEQPALL